MDVWVLIIAYTLLVIVSQFLIYRYLHGKDGSVVGAFAGDGTPAEEGQIRQITAFRESAHSERGDEDDDDARQCPQCGAANEPTYTFCRNCVNHLGP